jgi:class 3 adenylate cyclase/DNA-binding CsgD family transcriptional regulator
VKLLTDEGTLTVMFTEEESSTEFVVSRGDHAAREFLREQEEIIRHAAAGFGGREVDASGDGFLFVFASARKAIACAAEIQQALHRRPGDAKDLLVRIGLNAGDVINEEEKVYGSVVNVAARIAGRAGGGEILVSDIVRQLAGAVPNASFVEKGRFSLRGIPGRHRLFEVQWEPEAPPDSVSITTGPPLVGRDVEIETLREAVAAAAAGHGQVVLIEGEPGIGKTRLVEAACEHARTAGFEVFVGRSDDLVSAHPFAPFVAALGIVSNAPHPDRAAIAALVDTHDVSDTRSLPAAPNPGLQYRVIEALGALVERLAARGPLLLALDDLQWADASTFAAIRSIARRVETLPVLLLGSCRAGHDVAELHRVTDDLLRAGGTRLALGPLDDASVKSLITEVLEESPSDALLARVQGASGNPLFVIEYVRSIQATTSAGNGESDAALEFRLTVLRRLASLSEDTNEALRLAAILGSTFSPADLAVVSGKSIVQLTPAIHQAVVSAMLEERGDHLAFRHALVRDAIYEHIPSAVRRQLHREVGKALADTGADALVVAHHLGLGAGAEDPEAVDWLRRAARGAAPRSPAVAVELLRRARDLLGLTSPLRDELLAELAVTLAWSGQLAEAEALSIEVLERRPDPGVAGVLRCGLVYALTWQGRPREALRHTVLDPDERISDWDAALLKAEAAVASALAFDLKTAGSLAAEAAEGAERLGHELAHCHALTAQAWVANFAGRIHEAVDLARRAVVIADRSATSEAHLAHPRFFLGGIPLLALDRLDEAEEMLRSGLRIAENLGLAWSLPLYHAFLGAKGFIAGDFDGAIADLEAALAVADEVGLHIGIIAATSAWLAAIQLHRDDLDGAERTLSTAMGRLAETGPQLGMGPFNWARALVLEARQKHDEALALLQTAWDLFMEGGPVTDPSRVKGPMTDPWSAMAFVRMCVATGDHQRAASLLPAIEDQASAVDTPFMQGQALRCRGLVEQNPDTLVRAVALYRQCPRPLELAAVCEDAGVLLASTGRLEEAVPLWNEAIELYEGLGAERGVARLGAHLRERGIKRGTRRRHVRATSGWESLTETEHKVTGLVAQRLSNPEVAERLYISRHTVESHLKHIYRKLGLSSRRELAAVAVAHAGGSA